MHIGIFDSGLGGINVLNELLKKYPNNHYTFLGDTKNLPYGTKSIDELKTLSSKNIEFLLSQKVDIIIIACGTVSSNCYEYLKEKYNIPIYDIITPTLEYIDRTNYNNIGVIATERTINSHIFEKNKRVTFPLATPTFVPIIEDGIITEKEENSIKEVLKPLKCNIDALVLGCTHYPLLNGIISNYLNVPLIDMGKCLVDKITLEKERDNEVELYFTNINDQLLSNIKNNLSCTYSVKKVDLYR